MKKHQIQNKKWGLGLVHTKTNAYTLIKTVTKLNMLNFFSELKTMENNNHRNS